MLLKSSISIGFFTLLSRMLGYAREILMATILGAGPIANAFHIAFRFSNVFRSFFAEGAFTSSFVPMFTKKFNNVSEEDAKEYAGNILSVLTIFLVFFTIVIEIFMPQIMLVLAPGFVEHKEIFDLAIIFSRICFPYLLFMSFSSVYGGMLSSINKFLTIAISPILLNICMMVALLYSQTESALTGKILCFSIVVSGFLQLLLLYSHAKKLNLRLKLQKPVFNNETKLFINTLLPGILSASVTQINLWISTSIATLFDNLVSLMYYADRIVQLPLALIGTSIGLVLLPTLSKYINSDKEKLYNVINRSVEITMFLTIPTVVTILMLDKQIIISTFQYGAFTKENAVQTANLMSIMTFALPAFILNKIYTPCFYAMHDTKTPFRIAFYSLLVNAVVNLAFLAFYKVYISVAIATSISSWFNCVYLQISLSKKNIFKTDQIVKTKVFKIIIASLALLGFLYMQNTYLTITSPMLLITLVKIALGYIFYIAVSLSLKIYTVQELLVIVKRNKK